jgi:hypothetical protein
MTTTDQQPTRGLFERMTGTVIRTRYVVHGMPELNNTTAGRGVEILNPVAVTVETSHPYLNPLTVKITGTLVVYTGDGQRTVTFETGAARYACTPDPRAGIRGLDDLPDWTTPILDAARNHASRCGS